MKNKIEFSLFIGKLINALMELSKQTIANDFLYSPRMKILTPWVNNAELRKLKFFDNIFIYQTTIFMGSRKMSYYRFEFFTLSL